MSHFDDCYEVGSYRISKIVMKGAPPKHYVTDVRTGEKKVMSSPSIYKRLLAEGIRDLRFRYVRPKTPSKTQEEIEKQRQQKLERNREYERTQHLINTYKASSYLERLKAKHLKNETLTTLSLTT